MNIKDSEALTFEYIPDDISVRKEAYEKIISKFENAIERKEKFFFYISGSTGTGKIMVTKKIETHFSKKYDNLYVSYYNCARISPYDTILEMYRNVMKYIVKDERFVENIAFSPDLKSTGYSGSVYLKDILNILSKKEKSMFIILDDVKEIFVKNGKDIFYVLSRPMEFMRENSTIPPIYLLLTSQKSTIQTFLPEDIQSTIQNTPEHKITFNNYTVEEIVDILKARIKEAFSEIDIADDALEEIAILSYKSNLNARYAIDILRDSYDIASTEGCSSIDISHIRKAMDINDVNAYHDDIGVDELTDTQLLILLAITRVLDNKKLKTNSVDVENEFNKIIEEYGYRVSAVQSLKVSHPTFLSYLKKLKDMDVISMKTYRGGLEGTTTVIDSIMIPLYDLKKIEELVEDRIRRLKSETS